MFQNVMYRRNLLLIALVLTCVCSAVFAKNENILDIAADFFESVKKGDLEKVKLVIKTHPNIANQITNEGQSAAHVAVINGHKEMLQFLLTKIDANVVDEHNKTLLHYASFSPNVELAEFLLDKYVKLDAKDDYGETALHKAVKSGRLNMLKFLVSKGASIDEPDNEGKDALHIACCPYLKDIKESYLAKELIIIKQENNEATKAYYPKELPANISEVDVSVDVSIIAVILGKKRHVWHSKSYYVFNYNPLIPEEVLKSYSQNNILTEQLPLVDYLLNNKDDINKSDKFGMTPLHWAAVCGFSEAIQLLVNKGADVNREDKFGLNAIYHVVSNGKFSSEKNKIDSLKMLLKSGSDLKHSKDVLKKNAIDNDWHNLAKYVEKL
jgi:ankyrin repeat protein